MPTNQNSLIYETNDAIKIKTYLFIPKLKALTVQDRTWIVNTNKLVGLDMNKNKALENNISLTGTSVDYILEGVNKYLMALDKKFEAIVVDPVQTPDQLLEALSKHFAVGAEFYRETLAELADSPDVEPTKQAEEKPAQTEDSLDDVPEPIRDLIKSMKAVHGISVKVTTLKKKPE